jgi:hypothetical protein
LLRKEITVIDNSKNIVSHMAQLNNKIVELLDESKVSPCEAVMVLTLIKASLIKAFEIRATKEED